MIDAWGIVSLDECLLSVHYTREDAEHVLEKYDEIMLDCRIVEVKVNDTPPDARTVELEEKIRTIFEEKNIKHIHFSKGISFYEKPINERLSYFIDILTNNYEHMKVNLDDF